MFFVILKLFQSCESPMPPWNFENVYYTYCKKDEPHKPGDENTYVIYSTITKRAGHCSKTLETSYLVYKTIFKHKAYYERYEKYSTSSFSR